MNLSYYYRVILSLILEKKLYTTFATRTLFIYSSIVYNGIGYIVNVPHSDNYISDIFFEIEDHYINYYIEHVHILALSLLNTTFNSKTLLDFITLKANSLLTDDLYNEFKSSYVSELETIEKELYEYYNQREEDGWKDSNEQVFIQNYKNRIKLNLESDTENLSELSNVKKWTLIENKIMIGSKWGNVQNILSNQIVDSIENYLSGEYAKINVLEESNRLISFINNIDEETKISIKFFDELVGKISISGILNYFLISYFEHNQINIYEQIKLLNLLNSALFQASIIIYKTKYTFMDPNPIQIIRNLKEKYNYVPYSFESNLNFIDDNCCPSFISKDLTLLSVGINIFKNFLGNNIQCLNIILYGYELNELSSFYLGDYSNLKFNLSNVVIPIQNLIQKEKIQKDNVNLFFETWDDLMDYFIKIRLIGGIENTYSNKLGIIIGNEISIYITDLLYK